jgi:acid stress-induced BolA-like protein IbaG/YrbA
MEAIEVERRIGEALAPSHLEVSGSDAHFSALVVSRVFEGKTRVEQHRMIYALFLEEMSNQSIHALALRTCTPEEWMSETKQERH